MTMTMTGPGRRTSLPAQSEEPTKLFCDPRLELKYVNKRLYCDVKELTMLTVNIKIWILVAYLLLARI